MSIFLIACVGVAVVYLLLALVLVVSQKPETVIPETGEGMTFTDAIAQDYSDLPELQFYKAQDGVDLPYRRYKSEQRTKCILILIHGSAWHGMQFHQMAQTISNSGLAEVIVPDMRGHGAHPQRRGDVDYIDQFEDDIAALVSHVKHHRTKVRIVLGGHSSGGGLVLRFAGGKHADLLQNFVFMAPFIRHDAPTTRPKSGGWAHPLIWRIIGLTMLNRVGITALNHLWVISFAMPRAVLDGPYGDAATTAYSYRANLGFAPHVDYESDIAALKSPFLLIAASEDEAFVAEGYEPLFTKFTEAGEYVVLPGVNHIGLVSDAVAISTITRWMGSLD